MTTTRVRAAAGNFGTRVTRSIKTTIKKLLVAGLVITAVAALVSAVTTILIVK